MIRWPRFSAGRDPWRVGGRLSQRLDHRAGIRWASVLVGGMAFAGIGMFGYALAPAWILLLGAAFIASIGKGTMDAGLNNFVSANYGASEMNWLHACWGIGLTIAPAVVTNFVLDQGGGWQASYVFVGLVIFAIGLAHPVELAALADQCPQRQSKSRKRAAAPSARVCAAQSW